jgi:flagellar biosynthesis protein FliR
MMAEVVVMGMQILGFQAGYGYASTIDPNTQSDSGILLVLAQLFASMMFFAFGWDRQLILIFANSLQAHPPGSWTSSLPMAHEMTRAASAIFSIGFETRASSSRNAAVDRSCARARRDASMLKFN